MLSVFLIPPGGLTSEADNSICQNKCKIQRAFLSSEAYPWFSKVVEMNFTGMIKPQISLIRWNNGNQWTCYQHLTGFIKLKSIRTLYALYELYILLIFYFIFVIGFYLGVLGDDSSYKTFMRFTQIWLWSQDLFCSWCEKDGDNTPLCIVPSPLVQ